MCVAAGRTPTTKRKDSRKCGVPKRLLTAPIFFGNQPSSTEASRLWRLRGKGLDRGGATAQDPGMDLRIQCLCVDTTDPARSAAFWQGALGWQRTHDGDDEVVLEPPAGGREHGVVPDLLFLRVPESKSGKNRLHLDLRPRDQAAEVARLEQLGARHVDVGQGREVSWVVLADPDGNEFCVLRPLTAAEQAE